MKRLNELLDYLQPAPYIVSSEFYVDSYKTPVLTPGKTFVLGFTDDTKGIYSASENPVILFDDFTTASKWVDFDFKVKSSACKILIGKQGVDLRYVYHAMQSIQFDSSEHKRYWIKDYSQITIPYPDKQKRDAVVNILDGILGQIESAQNQMHLCEEQVKSLFNDLFIGDELHVKLSYYIKELRAGKSLASVDPCQNKVLKTGAATFGEFDPKQVKYLPRDYAPNPMHLVEKGDVIISRMNTPELVGACSYVWQTQEHTYYPDRLWKTICTSEANPIFLWKLMWREETRKGIKSVATGTSGTMFNISKERLLGIEVPLISRGKQDRFAQRLIEIDKLRFKYQRQIELLNELMEKKMEEYFGGEEDA